MYADDTSAFTTDKDVKKLNDIMNTGLDKLNTWFQTNKLSLNLKKTNYMLFGTRSKTSQLKDQFKLSISNTDINQVDAFKFLGVTIDQNLTWKNQIDNLAKNVLAV